MHFQVAVIGATGYIGTPYRSEIRDSADDARIVALCARRRERLEQAAAEDACGFVTDDWRQVVDRPDVNFVVVATPDVLHHAAVMACAERGKHLFCEKPIGANSEEAYEMWCAYRDASLGHFVPFWARYLNVFGRAKQIVAEGVLGEIKAIIYRWHNPRPAAMPFTWRDDASLSAAGSIADVGSHAYDIVRWITGSEATRVLAHADVITEAKPDLGAIDLTEALEWGDSHTPQSTENYRKGTAYDYAAIAWEFQNGAVGTIVLSHAPILRKGLAPELELHGTRASLAIERDASTLTVVHSSSTEPIVEQVDKSGLGNRFGQYVFPAIRQRAAGAECEHPGLHDGWRVQIFTDAAVASAQLGAWVPLSDFDAEA